MGSKHSSKKVEIVDKKLIPDSENETNDTSISIEEEPNIFTSTKNKNIIIDETQNDIDKNPKEEEKQYENCLIDIISQFSFPFYDETFDPNFLSWKNANKNLVFFDSKELRDSLEKKLKEIEVKHKKHYEDLKQPLEEYMKTKQNQIYKENRGFFKSIGLRFKFIFEEESFNEDIRRKAKRIAFLLSQIKAELEEKADKRVIITLMDPYNYKISTITNQILDEIKEKLDNIDIKTYNIEEIEKSLNLLEDKLKLLYNRLENEDCYFDDSDNPKELKDLKKIYKAFLAYEIHIKLKEIEKADNFKGTEAYKKYLSLKSSVNRIIYQNLDSDSSFDQEPFLGIILKEKCEYTIIKDTKKEKKRLFSGMNVEKFINAIKNHFKDQKIDLSKFEEIESEDINTNSEEDINFIQKKKSIIKNLEEKSDKNKKDINNINQKMFGQGIDIINNIVDNFDDDEKENTQKKEISDKKNEDKKGKQKNEEKENKEIIENQKNNENGKIKIKIGKKEIIEKTSKTARAIGDNIFQINNNYLEKKSIEKKEAVNSFLNEEIRKLMEIYLLINKFEDKAKNNKQNLNCIVICKNYNDEGNELMNGYKAEFIY